MSNPTPSTDGLRTERRVFSCSRCPADVPLVVTVLGSGKTFGMPSPVLCPGCRAAVEQEREQQRLELRNEARKASRQQAVAKAIALLATPKVFESATISGTEMLGNAESQRRINRSVFLAGKVVNAVVQGAEVPPLLAFVGHVGSGKTRMVYAIANDLTRKYAKTARVVKTSALVRDLRAPWRTKDGPSESERLEAYTSVDFLGIDEVSRHAFFGQQIHQHLWDVINARYEDEKPTVVTSNESREELEAILGPALTSRLQLGGHVLFPDEDFRPLLPREWERDLPPSEGHDR